MTPHQARGMVGLAALRRLASDPSAVRTCDERLLEKLLRRVLNDLPDFSDSVAETPGATWYQGAAGYLPDLMAEGQAGQFAAGIEVKSRAHVNWGWYGTDQWQSQLDCYARRTEEIDAGDAPLYLVVSTSNRDSIMRQLAAEGEQEIISRERWKVRTLSEFLEHAPTLGSTTDPTSERKDPAIDLLTSLLSDP